MFAPDLKFIGFTALEWTRLIEAMRPAEAVRSRPPGVQGGVVLVTEGRRLLKLVHTSRGRLDPDEQAWPEPLPEIARRHAARWVLSLEQGTLQQLLDRFADTLTPQDDYLKQLLSLLGLFRQYEAEGRLALWPHALSGWPVPSQGAALRALDAICPADHTLLLGVFCKGELYTGIAAQRGERGFVRVVGPSMLRPAMGLVSGDWTRDYRHLLRATEQLVGPVCVGCFAELGTLQELAGSRRPGAWAEAVAMREVILKPVVPALTIPLGLDVGRAALQGVKALAERARTVDWLAPEGPLGHLLERVQAVTASELASKNLEAMLGFDPLRLLYKLVQKRSPRE